MMHFIEMHACGSAALALVIVSGALLSEDAATITAAAFAFASVLDFRISFFSAIAGLWLGDLGVYGLARFSRERAEKMAWFRKLTGSLNGVSTGAHGDWRLAVSRFLPGTRLPAYVAAGLSRMSLPRFALITGVTAIAWTSVVFAAIWVFPGHAASAQHQLTALSLAGLALFALLYIWRLASHNLKRSFVNAWQRLVRWEFWPGWLFYAPVALICSWLGIRYRGLSLPSIANLNQHNGGIIGESKMEILRELRSVAPDFTAETYFVTEGTVEERMKRVENIVSMHGLTFPLVLKPDTAQRGAGFRKVSSLQDARNYLELVGAPLVLQRYVEGPHEAGIFYYRYPWASEGQIFGITRKRFPSVIGDGQHTIARLIENDGRARFLKAVYKKRLGGAADRVPALGERVRLVQAGNHCQGCIFEDGMDLYSEPLRRALDAISRQVSGFYVGRYDLRYTSDEQLRDGKGFRIIELNGAASEATNIYDARNSLWTAYGTLYRQWQLMYAIGAENRRRGAVPRPTLAIWRDWRAFRMRACDFPISD